MVLVGYSDSEGSDDEQSQNAPAKPTAKPTKPEPSGKLLNQESRKIRVNLSSLTSESTTNGTGDGDRPAKRARLGGGGLGGFNAMLPAPKNPTKSASTPASNGLSIGKGGSIGRGVSFKTSSQAAFSRDAPVEASYAQAPEPDSTTSNLPKPELEPELQEVKPAAGNNIRFVPKSVSKKKKKTPLAPPPSASASSAAAAPTPAMPTHHTTSPAPPPPKKKVSLFSTAEDPITAPLPSLPPPSLYKPLLVEQQQDQPPDPPPAEDEPIIPQHDSTPAQQPSNLQDLAATLNLSAAERRKLFGRHGNQPINAQVAQFNLAAEYQSNRELVEKEGALATHNPVKAIAPGKHSLQQLISNAQTQSEALEEQFASGKRNKREAGKKFGWG